MKASQQMDIPLIAIFRKRLKREKYNRSRFIKILLLSFFCLPLVSNGQSSIDWNQKFSAQDLWEIQEPWFPAKNGPLLSRLSAGSNTKLAVTDPIFSLLAFVKAKEEKDSKKNPLIGIHMTDWYLTRSQALKKLFPDFRFASIGWAEYAKPGARKKWKMQGIIATLNSGMIKTVAVNLKTYRIEATFLGSGNYEEYSKFLVLHKIHIRNEAEAQLVWDAFCAIHHWPWENEPLQKISDEEWHLGISKDETRLYYYKVMIDPKTGRILSARLRAESLSKQSRSK